MYLKNLKFLAYISQIGYTCIVTMGEKGSTKNIKFMTSGTRVALLGHGHIGRIVKMHLFLSYSPALRKEQTKEVYSQKQGKLY